MSKWTEEEVQYLRDTYSSLDTGYIAERLGRSEKAIAAKASKLGVRKFSYGLKNSSLHGETKEKMCKILKKRGAVKDFKGYSSIVVNVGKRNKHIVDWLEENIGGVVYDCYDSGGFYSWNLLRGNDVKMVLEALNESND